MDLKLRWSPYSSDEARAHYRLTAPPPPPLFFMERGGREAHMIYSWCRSSPRRSKKKQITYLSSCHIWKPELSSALSVFPSRSRCSYSMPKHDCAIDQSTSLLHTWLWRQVSKLNSENAKVRYWPILRDQHSFWCVVLQQITGTPCTENFPCLIGRIQ